MSNNSDVLRLNCLPVFIRSGFRLEEVRSISSADAPVLKNYLRLPENDEGRRRLQIPEFSQELKLPSRNFFSFQSFKPRSFTFVIPFRLKQTSGSSDVSREPLALLLGQIGESWEIYINGRLIRKETPGAGQENIPAINFTRLKLLAPLPDDVLRKGENILAFHIRGNPASPFTGFFRSSPFLLGQVGSLERQRSNLLLDSFNALYFLIGLYFIFLFLRRSRETHHLYFGLFSLVMFVYFLSQSHVIQHYIHDYQALRRLELAALFLSPVFFGLFLEKILFGKPALFSLLSLIFFLLLLFGLFLAPYFVYNDLLSVWRITVGLIVLPYYGVMVLGRGVLQNYQLLRRQSPGIRLRLMYKTMVDSVAGNLAMGTLVLFLGVAFDIIDSLYFFTEILITRYGIFVFTLGVVLVLAGRFQTIQKEVETLFGNLEIKNKDLNQMNARLSQSERKYRTLVEGANELIFTLNSDWQFVNANKAFFNTMNIPRGDIQNLNIMDLVYQSSGDRGMSFELIKQKLQTCVNEKTAVNMKVNFRSRWHEEPMEFSLRLEYLEREEDQEIEILGRATGILEDTLLRYFVREKQIYEIENFLITSEEISQRLVRNVMKYIDPGEIMELRIALREMIINAIEHGNLAITFDEKTRGLMEGDYNTFVIKRQNDPRYRDKRVFIEYELTQEKVSYRIRDEGEGFDHRKMRDKQTAVDLNESMIPHGRGIVMTEQFFDLVEYNEKGNEVYLERYFDRGRPIDRVELD